jgi:hypothetical protein
MMFKVLLGSLILTSVFDNSYNQRRKRYNKLVAKHRKQMDERIANYIRLIKLDSIAEHGVADGLEHNLDIFSLEDIKYILDGIYKELPESAMRISQYIDELPGTPQARGYGVDFV